MNAPGSVHTRTTSIKGLWKCFITFAVEINSRETPTDFARVGVAQHCRSSMGIKLGMESGGASMSHTVPLAMAVPAVRSLGRLAANNCYFFLCDMQEKFRPSIRYFPEIITVAQRMVSHGREG